jgi:hypothetical protein
MGNFTSHGEPSKKKVMAMYVIVLPQFRQECASAVLAANRKARIAWCNPLESAATLVT